VVSELRGHGVGDGDGLVFPGRFKRDRPYAIETASSYLAQSGASLLEIADVLGHKSLAMTKRYSHLTTQTKAKLCAMCSVASASKCAHRARRTESEGRVAMANKHAFPLECPPLGIHNPSPA